MKKKLLLYCTKGKPNLWKRHLGFCAEEIPYDMDDIYCNGKIVAECECEVEEIINLAGQNIFETKTLDCVELLKKTCLYKEQLDKYLVRDCEDANGYALHLANIKAFENPLELRDIYYKRKLIVGNTFEVVTKAPQNMMWVWYNGEKHCLISIRPEWLCKILNGEKTIEVRRKILKGML